MTMMMMIVLKDEIIVGDMCVYVCVSRNILFLIHIW
jgi:hypothetical protein